MLQDIFCEADFYSGLEIVEFELTPIIRVYLRLWKPLEKRTEAEGGEIMNVGEDNI